MPPVAFVIPARLGSQRLKNKAVASIGAHPMIVHVWQNVVAQNLGPVLVACDDPIIASEITERGGECVLTDPNTPTGSDRVAEAIELWDPEGQYSYVVNVQGDLPYFSVDLSLLIPPFLKDPALDMTTFVQGFTETYRQDMPHVVKVVRTEDGLCQDFTRQNVPSDCYHIGIYAFRREALRRFSALPSGLRERTENLEQLRALENGFKISSVFLTGETFISVDTQSDLDYARLFLQKKISAHGG